MVIFHSKLNYHGTLTLIIRKKHPSHINPNIFHMISQLSQHFPNCFRTCPQPLSLQARSLCLCSRPRALRPFALPARRGMAEFFTAGNRRDSRASSHPLLVGYLKDHQKRFVTGGSAAIHLGKVCCDLTSRPNPGNHS